jgi:hypothetical protein
MGAMDGNAIRTAGSAPVNTVTIMHFWHDGFVWSVWKRQVVQT